MSRQLKNLLLGITVVLASARIANAYTVVTVSSAAPAGTEAQVISQITTKFNATVVPNPFFANTNQITVYGANPNYLPPVTATQLLQQIDLDAQYMATVDSYTYTTGWADGVDYQQAQDVNTAQQMLADCLNPSFWNVPIDTGTCVGVASILSQAIFDEHFSTPTVTPGDWQ